MFKLKKNLLRTFIAGVLALLALCYALVNILEIAVYDMLLLVGTGVVIVVVLGIAGVLFGFVLFRLRQYRSKPALHSATAKKGAQQTADGKTNSHSRNTQG
ncbi:MAG: hypothetical protein HKO71_00355 [Pseudomonadales bacterium]|nr:hypothetical protein [Pseudomonadales bacterium]